MRTFFTLLISLCLLPSLSSQTLAITEVMYNPPESGTDSLEFIEVYNYGSSPVNAQGFTISVTGSSVMDTLKGILPPGGVFVTAVNKRAFQMIYGRAPTSQWSGSGLSNSGNREIRLNRPDGSAVVSFIYLNVAPWPLITSSNGRSIQLCNPTANATQGNNWYASDSEVGIMINGQELYASPFAFFLRGCGGGMVSYPNRTIGQLIQVDGTGTLDSIGATATISGTVNSIDFDGRDNLEFYIQDANAGIRIMSPIATSGYVVKEGDRLSIRGRVEQFNGSAQFPPDSIQVLSTGTAVTPQLVTSITESTQGQLVRIDNVSLVDPSQWRTSGNFNVDVTNGSTVTTVRIDADTNLGGENAPTGTFSVTGISNQFDPQSPYNEGYQLLPRRKADFNPFNPGTGPNYRVYTLLELRPVNPSTGVAVLLDSLVRVRGIVIGPDLRAGGLQFTIVNDLNTAGVGVFSFTDDFNYTVKEGDRVEVVGKIDQFNGLTQILADNVTFVERTSDVIAPAIVTMLNESTESRLVRIQTVRLIDPSQWGSDITRSYSLNAETGTGDSIVVRIDAAAAISKRSYVNNILTVVGIGGQFDRSSPYLSDYQILPRNEADLIGAVGLADVASEQVFSIQRTGDQLLVTLLLDDVKLYLIDAIGRQQAFAKTQASGTVSFNMSEMAHGMLVVRAVLPQGLHATKKIIW